MFNLNKLDTFTDAYIECALWASIDDTGRPLDDNYGPEDISPETLERMVSDCEDFQKSNVEDLREVDDIGRAGMDFWLTRERHGAGFWDGGYPADMGRRLTDNAHAYGEFTLYVGDDGLIHGM